jgi:hypothetical protein
MAEILAFMFAAVCFGVGSVSAYRQRVAFGPHHYSETLWYGCMGAVCACVALLSWLNR